MLASATLRRLHWAANLLRLAAGCLLAGSFITLRGALASPRTTGWVLHPAGVVAVAGCLTLALIGATWTFTAAAGLPPRPPRPRFGAAPMLRPAVRRPTRTLPREAQALHGALVMTHLAVRFSGLGAVALATQAVLFLTSSAPWYAVGCLAPTLVLAAACWRLAPSARSLAAAQRLTFRPAALERTTREAQLARQLSMAMLALGVMLAVVAANQRLPLSATPFPFWPAALVLLLGLAVPLTGALRAAARQPRELPPRQPARRGSPLAALPLMAPSLLQLLFNPALGASFGVPFWLLPQPAAAAAFAAAACTTGLAASAARRAVAAAVEQGPSITPSRRLRVIRRVVERHGMLGASGVCGVAAGIAALAFGVFVTPLGLVLSYGCSRSWVCGYSAITAGALGLPAGLAAVSLFLAAFALAMP